MPYSDSELKKLLQDVQSYIDENFFEEDDVVCAGGIPVDTFDGFCLSLIHALSPNEDLDGFDAYLERKKPDFSEVLYGLMQESGYKAKDIIERSGLARATFFSLQNGSTLRPRRESAIALAIAFGMNGEEADDFLGDAGYMLSCTSKRDLLFIYCFDHITRFKNGVVDVNIVLDKLNMPLIGKEKEKLL